MTDLPHERVVIIGSGPAGWTAAIYAARAELKPLVFEGAISPENYAAGTLPLGQLNTTTEVENYPGFSKPIKGPDLMVEMRAQAERVGTRILTIDVVDVDSSVYPFVITDSDGGVTLADSIIISTGASAKYPPLPSVEKFRNQGVSACAVCDGALPRYRDKWIAVVGGGDSACEEANYLSKYASEVYLIHRRDTLRASKIMADRALANPKIKPMWNANVTEILGNDADGVTAIALSIDKYPVDRVTISVAGVFFAIGHTPNVKFLKGQLQLDDKGFIWTQQPHATNGYARTWTSKPGIFAAGDVADPIYKQAITAAGSGCQAALDCERWLSHK